MLLTEVLQCTVMRVSLATRTGGNDQERTMSAGMRPWPYELLKKGVVMMRRARILTTLCEERKTLFSARRMVVPGRSTHTELRQIDRPRDLA
jgi:hypothetical protein